MPELAPSRDVKIMLAQPKDLPVGPTGRLGHGWWGIVTLIATEGALFSYLLFSYFYLGATALPGWLPDPTPTFLYSGPATVAMILSGVGACVGNRAMSRDNKLVALIGLGVAFAFTGGFISCEIYEWTTKPYGPGFSSYASIYYLTTGFDVLHAVAAMVALLFVFVWTAAGMFSDLRRIPVAMVAIYQYFVVAIWITIFIGLYVAPYLGFPS